MKPRHLCSASGLLALTCAMTVACGEDDGGQTPATTTTPTGAGTSTAIGGNGGTGQGGAGAGTSTGTASSQGGSGAGSVGGGSVEGECDDWQQQHPEWLWCDDFETEHDLTVGYEDTSLNGMDVSNADALSGDYSLRQHYTAGQVNAGWISKFFGDTLGNDYGPIQDHFYMRWFHKFEAGFQGAPPKMARITSIGPGWDKRFGVYYWIAGDDHEIVADVNTANGWIPVQHSGFFYSEAANIDRWTCHEMYVKANTPGQDDGAYAFWIDGVKVIDITGVSLVGSTDYHFNNCMLDCYWNGGSPAEQNRYYDNLVISTSPIGCGS
jgi:hypothetical protein